MRYMGEICRRPKAFPHFFNNRRQDVSARIELGRLKQYGLPPYRNVDPASATAKDTSERAIYERERYVKLLFGEQPITPQMKRYGGRLVAERIIIVNLKLRKPRTKTTLVNLAEGAKITPLARR